MIDARQSFDDRIEFRAKDGAAEGPPVAVIATTSGMKKIAHCLDDILADGRPIKPALRDRELQWLPNESPSIVEPALEGACRSEHAREEIHKQLGEAHRWASGANSSPELASGTMTILSVSSAGAAPGAACKSGMTSARAIFSFLGPGWLRKDLLLDLILGDGALTGIQFLADSPK